MSYCVTTMLSPSARSIVLVSRVSPDRGSIKRITCLPAVSRRLLTGGATELPPSIETIADGRPDAGPLGGLVGLLRSRAEAQIVAVACDMPYVTAALLKRLALSEANAAVLAPWRDNDERYEPLFARYDRARVLPLAERQLAGGDRSLQKLLRDAGTQPFALTDEEWPLIADWDEPADRIR